MYKRITGVFCAVLMCVVITVPVYTEAADMAPEVVSAAESAESAEDITVSVSNGVIGFTSNEPTLVNTDEPDRTTVSSIGFYPFEIKYDNHNGSPVVIKSFKVPAGYDPAALL